MTLRLADDGLVDGADNCADKRLVRAFEARCSPEALAQCVCCSESQIIPGKSTIVQCQLDTPSYLRFFRTLLGSNNRQSVVSMPVGADGWQNC